MKVSFHPVIDWDNHEHPGDLDFGIYRSSGRSFGRFIWGNTGLISILGYEDLADLQGVPIRELFIKPKKREALLEELQEKKFVKNRLLTLRRKDGKPVTVSVTALAEFDEKGQIQFINGWYRRSGRKAKLILNAGVQKGEQPPTRRRDPEYPATMDCPLHGSALRSGSFPRDAHRHPVLG